MFNETLTHVGPVLECGFGRKMFRRHLKGQYSTFRANVTELERTITERKVRQPVHRLSEAILWLLQVRYSFRPLVTHAMKGWITQDIARIIQPKWMMKVLEGREGGGMSLEEMLADMKTRLKPRGPARTKLDVFHVADAVARTAEIRPSFRSTAFGLLEGAVENSLDWQDMVSYTHSLTDERERNTTPFQISRSLTTAWDRHGHGDFIDAFLGRETESGPEQGNLFDGVVGRTSLSRKSPPHCSSIMGGMHV